MDIAAFAALTRNVICDNGFDDFIPVACLPARREILGLEGIGPESDIEAASLDWAKSLVDEAEEFLVAFKAAETQFKIVHRLDGTFESAIFEVEE